MPLTADTTARDEQNIYAKQPYSCINIIITRQGIMLSPSYKRKHRQLPHAASPREGRKCVLACCRGCKVQKRVVCWKEVQQHLGLPVGYSSGKPGVELRDVGFQGDAAQPAVQAEGEMPHGRGHISQHHPQGNGNPGSVGVNFVVLTLG